MSIRKRGKDTYQIYVYLGRDPVTGAQIRDAHTFHGSITAARSEERRLLRERDLGTYVSPATITVKEYLAQWLRDYAKPSVAPTTYEGYARCVKRYLEPHIGIVPLSKLRPLHVQSAYAALQEEPKRRRETLRAYGLARSQGPQRGSEAGREVAARGRQRLRRRRAAAAGRKGNEGDHAG